MRLPHKHNGDNVGVCNVGVCCVVCYKDIMLVCAAWCAFPLVVARGATCLAYFVLVTQWRRPQSLQGAGVSALSGGAVWRRF